MNSLTHRIRRQRWDVKTRTCAEAFEVRAQIRRSVDEGLLLEVSKTLDAHCPPEGVLRVPRIEIRIVVSDLAGLAESLSDLVCQQLDLAMIQFVESKQVDLISAITEEGSDLDALGSYLMNGLLPWHAMRAERTQIIERLGKVAQSHLSELAQASPSERVDRRIAYIYRLLQLLPEHLWPQVALHSLPPTFLDSRVKPWVPARVVRARFEALRTEAANRDLYLSAAARWLASGEWPSQRSTFLPTRPHCAGLAAPEEANKSGPARTFEPGTIVGHARADATLDQALGSSDARLALPDLEFGLSVRHGGLVLLHPFLPRLFDALGITQQGTPGIALAQRSRAAAMLHWLATGDADVYEFELTLIKVLLGMHPHSALNVSAGLIGDGDRDEGQALLASAIGHWPALKETSASGLRVSFLQRHGVLHEDTTGWQLHLEGEPFDLLLYTLPWALSTVKLPWMTRPLFTQWPPH